MVEFDTLPDWLDRHHVDVVRTFATTLDGVGVGKYVHRNKFYKSLPKGHAIADMALSMDLAGFPHVTFWHDQRLSTLGDMYMQPDLTTLISDGTSSNLGHCICDFVALDGEPVRICPRTTLKRMVNALGEAGYTMKATFELEFFLYGESFEEISKKKYQDLVPITANKLNGIYRVRNSYQATTFMDEVIKRMEWKGIGWEGWNDEAGVGQLELNLEPSDPVHIADNVMRTKQILYEVACDMGMAVTFMPKPGEGYASGMHVHHSLWRDDEAAFYDAAAADKRSEMLLRWIGGLMKTLPGAVSYLSPTVNSYRRMVDFAAVPVAASWGEENKSASLRLITQSPAATRVEYRIGASDLNPYLALAVMIAGGLAGLRHGLVAPDEFHNLAWGLPSAYERLPNTISKAAEALAADEYLAEVLGKDVVEYWIKSREHEWLSFYTEGGDPESTAVSAWEYERYFAII
ncbi:MAG TPA: glutamine synthetase family protein [Pseudomonadales bacterium]|nr:glutamine synthetase family protein [Pseudomonadales bacterium]